MCRRRGIQPRMGQPSVREDRPLVGVVDIGTNSMRLLVTDGSVEMGRWVEVTGLGRGVDASGRLSDEAMERTIDVLAGYGRIMDEQGVEERAAMATSATRDADNRDEFLQRVAGAIGVRPEVIAGDVEGELAYSGATCGLEDEADYVVSDIGGGSTEFVRRHDVVSIDIGSVRLTDRLLPDRPPGEAALRRASHHVSDLFGEIDPGGDLIGVAGTWTTLGAIDLDLDSYDRDRVHHHSMSREGLAGLTERLGRLTVAETAAIPSMDPARAPVILAGAIIAGCVMEAVDAAMVLVSERDTLDGLAMTLLGLR
jgi:exopolyphosphatase/guanosine-5'-triphosphate,3'-diphosphate pyrophosphatase